MREKILFLGYLSFLDPSFTKRTEIQKMINRQKN